MFWGSGTPHLLYLWFEGQSPPTCYTCGLRVSHPPPAIPVFWGSVTYTCVLRVSHHHLPCPCFKSQSSPTCHARVLRISPHLPCPCFKGQSAPTCHARVLRIPPPPTCHARVLRAIQHTAFCIMKTLHPKTAISLTWKQFYLADHAVLSESAGFIVSHLSSARLIVSRCPQATVVIAAGLFNWHIPFDDSCTNAPALSHSLSLAIWTPQGSLGVLYYFITHQFNPLDLKGRICLVAHTTL